MAKAEKLNPVALLQAMLRQVKINDPHIRALIRKEFGKIQKRNGQAEIDKEIIRRLRIQNKKLQERIIVLKEQLKETKTNRNQLLNRLGDLRKLNRSLSEALGSCSICWGEDDQCEHCGGEGAPGWRSINKRLFSKYILPVSKKNAD